ncbi:GNAT family N-acetyltransferase [Lactobacillus johnsonii]|uniref:GNAT family N-acetyltransferase n=1 Tax=Lactobacillus johnsonii TaxID=33959 RepID=UPI00398A8D94
MFQIDRLVMSEEVMIRKYKNMDYVQLCQVHDQARMQELIVGNAVDLYAPLEVALYKEELFSETLYVAEVDKQVVGFVAFRENELGYIYVLNEFQGKGIGGKLLDTVIPYLERPAFLEVFPTNIKAKRLYRSRGFVEETKEKMIFANCNNKLNTFS